MSSRIEHRDDVNPERGEHEYGDVEFADPTNKKYPIDTPEHIRAAWSYSHHKDSADRYSVDDMETIRQHIEQECRRPYGTGFGTG